MRDNWVTKQIFEFGDVISGGTPSTTIEEFWNGDIVWITPADLSKKQFPEIKTSGKKITLYGLKNSSANLIPAGSIVMSSRAPIGYFAVPSVDFSTNQGCKSVNINNENDSLFHYYNFLYNVDVFKKRGEGTTFAEISKKEVEKLYFTFPEPLPQQQKIAKILSTVDTVIEQTQTAIAKYQAIKQGLMHDLFTRGIDVNTGKLRPTPQDAPELYKESALGWIPMDWELNTVDEVAFLRHGYQFRDYDFTDEGIDVVKIGQVGRDGNIDLKKASKIAFSRLEEFKSIQLFEGDVLMALTGATLGKTAIIQGIDKPMVQNYRVGYFEPKNINVLNKLFLYYLLIGENIQNEILGFVNTGAQGNIGKADFEKISIVVPNTVDEQKLISNKLSALDTKIQTEQQALAKYQQLKAGLMQDLLTGRVEVNV